jgi:hypothetical protein
MDGNKSILGQDVKDGILTDRRASLAAAWKSRIESHYEFHVSPLSEINGDNHHNQHLRGTG